MPTITYAALCRSLSRERLAAYSLDTDQDSTDAVARYQWNLALAAALGPGLHFVEIALRNALYLTGQQTTAGRIQGYRQVRCWLDAVPSFLEAAEQRAVQDAILRLGVQRRRTPGHLVGQLGFGFWVRLCNRPYEHGRPSGPGLWPAAVRHFPGCPRKQRTRHDIYTALAGVRDLRNQIAHHQPVWDRDPVALNERVLEVLGWMNPSLGSAVRNRSLVEPVFAAGLAAYRTPTQRDLGF